MSEYFLFYTFSFHFKSPIFKKVLKFRDILFIIKLFQSHFRKDSAVMKKNDRAYIQSQEALKKGKGFFRSFREFAFKGNMIDLAVGVIIGAAFKTIVDSLVGDIISPLIGIFANVDFSQLSWTIKGEGDNAVVLRYGAFLTAVINFIIMAFFVYLLIRFMRRVAALGTKEKEDEAAATEKICPFCKTEIPVEAVRCPHCTSALEAADTPETDAPCE